MQIDPKVNILMVDDEPTDMLFVEAVLSELGQNLVKARSGAEALRCAAETDFAVILLDIQMADMDGFETARLLKKNEKTRCTPIVFVTAHAQNDTNLFTGYSAGAIDYLYKPVVPQVLQAKVSAFVELFQKSEEVKRQAELLREIERREHERLLAEEKQRWELVRLREEKAKEYEVNRTLSLKNDELARSIAERDQAEAKLLQAYDKLEQRVEERTAALAQANLALYEEIHERELAQKSLRRSEARFRAVAQSANDAIVASDASGMIIFWNQGAEKIFGYREEEIVGRQLSMLIPTCYRQEQAAAMAKNSTPRESRLLGKTVDMQGLRKDGTEFPVAVSLAQWKTDEGTFYSGFIRDITERKRNEDALRLARDELEMRVRVRTEELARSNVALQAEIVERRRAEEKMAASLKEKEVLLREIHHRVNNNLQVISSLFNLQSRYIQDPKALEMFKESQNRVRSMALIHEKLYRSKDLARVDFGEYIHGLTAFMIRSYGLKTETVRLEIDVESVFLGIDTVIPCALIINEMVSNSLKYAFPDERTGVIRISLKSNGLNRYQLTIRDDGVGFPQGLDFRTTESLGLQIVTALTEQINGAIELETKIGTTFRITFEDVQYKERK